MAQANGNIKGDAKKFDVLILGGGPGGTRAAYILAKAKKRVGLISNELGGECLNYGCIPTKVYLWSADLLEKISNANSFGFDAINPKINWSALQKRKNDVVSKLKKNLRFTLEQSGVNIIEGTGAIKDTNTIAVNETKNILRADFIIIAIGSRAFIPSGFENCDRVVTNHEILDLPKIPQSLLIIGGGVIGVEFASIFNAFGSEVTIAESNDRLLPREDSDIGAELERIFVRRKIKILKNTKMNPDEAKPYEKILIASGRRPIIDENFTKIGIKSDQKGIQTDQFMRTSIPSVFAIGDVAGKAMLAYTAEREGEMAARVICGEKVTPMDYDSIPNAIFSVPEIASVGKSEGYLREKNISYRVGKALASANSKALIVGNRDGFAKILVENSSRKILGIHIICEKASELIAEASLAFSLGITVDQLLNNLHCHPVLGELIKEASENIA